MNISRLSLAAATLFSVTFLTAQPVDDTELKQMIIFARHGVRAPVVANSTIDNFSAQPYPVFSVATGNLTDNGRKNETLLGTYYRLWLTKEGLLTGNDSADATSVYFRANGVPLITDTAKAFWAGMLPGADVNVHAQENDPLFAPLAAGVAKLDAQMSVATVQGRLGSNAQSLASAYAPELALTRSILLGYPASQSPVPPTPAHTIDVTALPIAITTGTAGSPVDLGGLSTVIYAIDPFVMEYADGMPDAEVGWGKLTAGGISQITRLYNLALDLEYGTPYLAVVQSSNVASHIVRSLLQAATGNPMTGTVGNPSSKIVVLTAANTNLVGLAALLHLDWVLPGYPADTCAPGGAINFELRQSQRTGAYIVRASYVTQSMDQLRNRTTLTLDKPPSSAPVFIPGCSIRNATFDCPLTKFVEVVKSVIDPRSVDLNN